MKKIIRACTVSMSTCFVEGMLPDLKKKYEVILLSSPGQELDEAERKYGVRGIRVPMERHISLMRDVVALWRLIRIFRRERPKMVHSMTPKAGLLCMLAGRLTGVPVRVHTFTGLVWPTSTGLKRKILMATDRLTCACATHIIPEGKSVMNDLRNHGITKKPMRVLGYGNVKGVDMDYYSRLRVQDSKFTVDLMAKKVDSFVFLFVGRIVKDKGINELCRAFNLLSGFAPARLILVGDYEDTLDPISAEARKIISDNPAIEAVGPKYGDELLAYYATADCFVFPSYREGFPNTVLEAGAMGLPSIVTDINGSRDIIKQGENGVIIPPMDENALFDAMLAMLKDKNSREWMAKKARGLIASRFEQGFVRQCLYDFYDEIL